MPGILKRVPFKNLQRYFSWSNSSFLFLLLSFFSGSKLEITDRYSEVRYNPNRKDEAEGIVVELKESYQEDVRDSPLPSLNLTCSSSQDRLTAVNHHLNKRQPDAPPVSDRVSVNTCTPPASISDGPYLSPKNLEHEGKVAGACQYSSRSSICSSGSSAQTKDFKQRRCKRDFIGNNKVTLGLAAQQNNSYLQLYSKKQRGSHPGQVSERPSTEYPNDSRLIASRDCSKPFLCLPNIFIGHFFQQCLATSSEQQYVNHESGNKRSCPKKPQMAELYGILGVPGTNSHARYQDFFQPETTQVGEAAQGELKFHPAGHLTVLI